MRSASTEASNKLLGIRYGKLIVIGFYEPGTKPDGATPRTYATVLCRCDCGIEKRVLVDNIRNGGTTSCGCFKSESSSQRYKELGKVAGKKRRKYSTYESSARDLYQKYMKRHAGDLEFDKFLELTQSPCYYCGTNPHQKYLRKNATDDNGTYTYNGLDRLDSTKGYNLNNMVPCCGTCNTMKLSLSVQEFYAHMLRIISNKKEDIIKLGIG